MHCKLDDRCFLLKGECYLCGRNIVELFHEFEVAYQVLKPFLCFSFGCLCLCAQKKVCGLVLEVLVMRISMIGVIFQLNFCYLWPEPFLKNLKLFSIVKRT